ncbi:helix-turn-helix domain-containing protein [Beduinella massiliensis]|uniref:helix-turn-helix domain-containing protein n=1 Tax=Beduinella massiliensis TaxID=1852363 RepID=UPI000C8220F2
MISYKIVGNHIRNARLRLGLNQAEAAERAGISTPYYSKYERGVIKPNLDRLGDICIALNIPLETVFQGALITEDRILDNMPPSAEEFEQYLQEITKKADDRTKRIMMRICDELANLQAETSKEAE